ncbi:hypothetical protein [Candidatus Uabimicrobium sp. HlEnr_7]|uniref:hypothetical protein n=1 Tax=Candidatus Uabimicrobium helgolandensis TaxID=3095367 RepID=UPI00355618F5
MYRICMLLMFLLVSCQNSKPKEEIVYETLPKSDIVNISSAHPVYKAEVIESKSTDLSAGNESLLDIVENDTSSIEDNTESIKLKLQLREQQQRIARLEKENLNLRQQDQKITKKKLYVRDKHKEKSIENSLLEKDKDVILGSSKDENEQKQKILVRSNSKSSVNESKIVEKSIKVAPTKKTTQAITKKQTTKVQTKSQTDEFQSSKISQNVEKKRVAFVYSSEGQENDVSYTLRKHCLRIISLPVSQSEQIAKNIIDFLKQRDIEAVHHRIQNFRVVDIVSVPAFRTPEAKAFQKKIHQLSYQGRRQFKDAYYTARKK